MRRVLVSQTRMPSRDRDSGSNDVANMIDVLLEDGWSVTFLARDTAPDPANVRALRRRGVAVYAGFAHAEQLIADGAFDLAVLCFWEPASRIVPILRSRSPSTRIIVNSMDLHFVRETRRTVGLDRGLTADAGERMIAELNTYRDADAVLTVSDHERTVLASLIGEDGVHVLPLAEDIAGSDPALADRSGMVFVGNFLHLPNGEAVEYLCRDILPLVDPDVRRRHPLHVVGNELGRELVELGRGVADVVMTGWVPSIVPYVERARVCVVPLLHGAGVKRKVIQAMQLRTPVVTTSIGAEGLELVDGEHALVADDPVGFAAAIDRLASDDDLWIRIAAAGHEHAARYSRPRMATRFREIVAEVMAAAPSSTNGAFRHGRDREDAYERSVARTREIAGQLTEPGSTVLVVSRGDDDLVRLVGRIGTHFPQDDAGGWAGYHPADGAAALRHLASLQARGARYLAIPRPSFWWLDFYGALRDHLNGRRIFADADVVLFDLAAPPRSSSAAVPEHDADVVVLIGDGDDAPPPAFDAAGREGFEVTTRRGSFERLRADGEAPGGGGHRWTVYVSAPAILGPTTVSDLLTVAEAVGADRAQPTHTAGPSAGPPVTERLGGCVARRVAGPTPLPVLAVRAGASLEGPTVLVDAATIGLDRSLGDVRAPSEVDRVWTGDPVAPVPALVDRRHAHDPAIAVVIATHERPDLLRRCVAGFAEQLGDDAEIVVVDDGSADDGATRRELADLARRLPIAYVTIAHAGRSAAKNLGVLLARAPIALLFDDDDVPARDLLARHLAHHAVGDGSTAVLGRTEWAPDLPVTPVMRFLTDVDRVLFAYRNLRDGQLLDWRGFWEGRISCPRELLVRHGLHDQRLDYSIDIEMAYRLARHGLRVRYRADAVSHMARPIDVDDFLRRSESKARAQATIVDLHPGDGELRDYCGADELRALWYERGPDADNIVATARRLAADIGPTVAPDDPRLDALHDALRAAHRIVSARGAVASMRRPADRDPVPTPAFATALPPPAPDGAAQRVPAVARPELTVVVAVWSRTRALAEMAVRTVDRIWEVAAMPTDVVVVDNGSPHVEPLRARVHRYEENRGVATAWNAGIALARAPVVVVLNSDCMVEAGWDRALHEAASTGRRIAFPYTDHADGRGFRSPDQAGTAGWCFALSRAVFDEIGPFDERFNPAYGEDTDYWHRAWSMGVELAPVPAARVVHARRSTARSDPHVDWLLTGHRYKYGWKHGVEPLRAPPYYHREIVEYHVSDLDVEGRDVATEEAHR